MRAQGCKLYAVAQSAVAHLEVDFLADQRTQYTTAPLISGRIEVPDRSSFSACFIEWPYLEDVMLVYELAALAELSLVILENSGFVHQGWLPLGVGGSSRSALFSRRCTSSRNS